MTNIFARHRQTVVRWIIASGIGLATAIAYLRHFVQPQTPRRLDQAILLSYLVCLFAALAYLVVFRGTWPRLRPFATRAKIAGGAAALAAGALLVVAIPLNPPASFATGALSFVADAMSIGALVFVVGVWLATRPARAQATHAR